MNKKKDQGLFKRLLWLLLRISEGSSGQVHENSGHLIIVWKKTRNTFLKVLPTFMEIVVLNKKCGGPWYEEEQNLNGSYSWSIKWGPFVSIVHVGLELFLYKKYRSRKFIDVGYRLPWSNSNLRQPIESWQTVLFTAGLRQRIFKVHTIHVYSTYSNEFLK